MKIKEHAAEGYVIIALSGWEIAAIYVGIILEFGNRMIDFKKFNFGGPLFPFFFGSSLNKQGDKMEKKPIIISKLWTHEEKLKIIVIITDMIRDDINMERYGRAGRPNIQAIHLFVAATPEECELYREDIEKYLNDSPMTDDWDNWRVGSGASL